MLRSVSCCIIVIATVLKKTVDVGITDIPPPCVVPFAMGHCSHLATMVEYTSGLLSWGLNQRSAFSVERTVPFERYHIIFCSLGLLMSREEHFPGELLPPQPRLQQEVGQTWAKTTAWSQTQPACNYYTPKERRKCLRSSTTEIWVVVTQP